MTRLLFAVASLILLFAAQPARAATTVYGDSIYDQSGPVVNPGGALGAADGNSAVITRPGELILALGGPTLDPNFVVNGVLTGRGGQVRVALGAIVNGVAVFTANQNFRGVGPQSFDFSTECASFSPLGCTLVRFTVTGSPAGVFTLDGVSSLASTPEPGQWALMILSFIMIAWRLKALRKLRRAEPRLGLAPV